MYISKNVKNTKTEKLSWGPPDGGDRSVSSTEYVSFQGYIKRIKDKLKYSKTVQKYWKSIKNMISLWFFQPHAGGCSQLMWISQMDQNWPKLTKIDQNWQKLIKIDQNWLKLTKIDKNWPKLIKINQNWPKLTKID